jgi:hypothetical protein
MSPALSGRCSASGATVSVSMCVMVEEPADRTNSVPTGNNSTLNTPSSVRARARLSDSDPFCAMADCVAQASASAAATAVAICDFTRSPPDD